jgi:hypothetical protein
VNAVFRGSVVGGPAYAPRVSGPLKLPTNQEELDIELAGILPRAKSENTETYSAVTSATAPVLQIGPGDGVSTPVAVKVVRPTFKIAR